jgi:4-amino-4-deoxy-L-arabinose transferase-like glycosyltransferase
MKPKHVLILFLILGVAMFFRFYGLTETPPGLYPDEAMNGNNALETIESGGVLTSGKAFYPENNGREGFFINIQTLFLQGFLASGITPEPWMLRIPSAIFGVLTVLGIFFLAREIFKEEGQEKALLIGLVAAFFLATSFWHINFSRIGFRAIIAPFFLIWGIWALLFALRKNKEWIFALLAGGIYGLGMHSYIAYRATPLILLGILFIWIPKVGTKNVLKTGAFFILGAIIVFLPLGFYFMENPADFFGRTTQVSVFSSENPLNVLVGNTGKTILMFFSHGDENWRHNLSGSAQLFWPVGLLFAFGFLATLMLGLKNKNRRVLLIPALWLFVAALPVVISDEGIPHALRAILMLPPALLLAAWSTMEIHEWLRRKNIHPRPCAILGTLFCIAMATNSYYAYFILWAEAPETKAAFTESSLSIAHTINALPPTIPKYVIVDAKGTIVRGIPMPAQSVMFLTKSFTEKEQQEKNIHYILPHEDATIPSSAALFVIR